MPSQEVIDGLWAGGGILLGLIVVVAIIWFIGQDIEGRWDKK